jgi:hypothetical protein
MRHYVISQFRALDGKRLNTATPRCGAVLGWPTEKQGSLPLRFFWIKRHSLTAITNHKNSLKGNIRQESITPQAVGDIVKEYGTLIGNRELAT